MYVYGDLGYTYNAHLMQPGVTGQVSAGDVIGYVGETGDTTTPHDHFEWHPNTIPIRLAGEPLRLLGHRVRREPVPAARAGLLAGTTLGHSVRERLRSTIAAVTASTMSPATITIVVVEDPPPPVPVPAVGAAGCPATER